jgi:hypothetical protein
MATVGYHTAVLTTWCELRLMVVTWVRLKVETVVGDLLPEASGVRPKLQQAAQAMIVWCNET